MDTRTNPSIQAMVAIFKDIEDLAKKNDELVKKNDELVTENEKLKKTIDELNEYNDKMNRKYINELMKIKDDYHSKLKSLEKKGEEVVGEEEVVEEEEEVEEVDLK
jgi:regulator of replication initiation timing